jgi:hypothetical protein
MTEKTKTTTKVQEVAHEAVMPASHMTQDLKNSVLIVSIVANLFILTAWIILQVTSQYDTQLMGFLFTR